MSDAPSRLSAALSARYAVERLLGEGGMATVYLAADVRHNRRVALKEEDELLELPIERTGSGLAVGSPRRLLTDTYRRDGSAATGGLANYDVTPDGVGFVMVEDGARQERHRHVAPR